MAERHDVVDLEVDRVADAHAVLRPASPCGSTACSTRWAPI